jgi:hypothetical protein
MKWILPIAVAAGVLALAGCGGDADTATPGTTPTETAVETTAPPTDTTAPPTETTAPRTETMEATETTEATETSPAETTPAKPKPRTIVVVVDQGRPRGGIKRPKLAKGEKVVLVIRSDAGEAVHVHGYDVEKPLTPGKPLRIPITANRPGRFEVELHHPDVLLAVLEVRP